MRCSRKAALVLAAALSRGPAANAAPAAPLPDDVVVHWSAPSECPDQDAVLEAVASRLARPTRAVLVEAVVEGRIVEEEEGYVLDLSVTLPRTTVTRQIRARRCDLLARATGVIVSVAMDPRNDEGAVNAAIDEEEEAGEESLEPAPVVPEPPPAEPLVTAGPTTPPPPEDGPAPAPVAGQPPQRQLPRVGLALRVQAGGGAGVLPRFGAGLGLALGMLGHHWRIEANGTHWFSRRADFTGEPNVGATLSLWSAGLRACGVLRAERTEFPLCGGPELGAVLASGFGGDTNHDVQALWAAIVAAPAVIWAPRPWIGLFAGLEGFVALTRPGFGGEDRQELHRAAPIGIRILGGVELRLPGRATAS